MKQKWYKKASVQTALVYGVFLLIGIALPYFFKVPALENEIKNLSKECSDKSDEIQRLETQLTPFKTVALEYYPGPEAEALSKLALKISEIENSISNVQDYSLVARLDLYGGQGGISFGHPIADILRGCFDKFTNEDGKTAIRGKCDNESISKYHKVITEHPNFPFSYYFLAVCLNGKGDPQWIEYANKARKIFLETTKISGHDPQHDLILKQITLVLNKNKKTNIDD
jgi:hypothetical protein